MTDSPPAASAPDLTVTEVAERLRVSRFTVYRMIRRRQFPGAYRLAGAYRIPASTVLTFIAQNEVGD